MSWQVPNKNADSLIKFGLMAVFPLGRFFSANQRFGQARANNFGNMVKFVEI